MHDDYSLLRRYSDHAEPAAFRELVDRYVHFVYSVALRRAKGDANVATNATQQTFAVLARSAGRLTPDTILAAWLHSATRNAVLKSAAAPVRPPATSAGAPPRNFPNPIGADWETVAPVVDDAVDEMLESERAPLVLRFFRRLSFADTGATLAITDVEARLRVERALERLRAGLAKRGIGCTAADLAATLSAAPAFPAPDGLAAAIAAQSGAGAENAAAESLRSFFSIKVLVTAAVAAVLGFFGGSRIRPAVAAPSRPDAQLDQSIAALRTENDRLKQQVLAVTAENERMKLAAVQAAGRRPTASAPAASHSTPVAAEATPPATADSTVDGTNKPDASADPHLQELKRKIEPAVERAIIAYRAAHQGANPTQAQDLVPYFTTPQEGADFIEYVEANKHAP